MTEHRELRDLIATLAVTLLANGYTYMAGASKAEITEAVTVAIATIDEATRRVGTVRS